MNNLKKVIISVKRREWEKTSLTYNNSSVLIFPISFGIVPLIAFHITSLFRTNENKKLAEKLQFKEAVRNIRGKNTIELCVYIITLRPYLYTLH